MIELVGSKVVTRKPTDIDLETVSELTEEDADDDEGMLRAHKDADSDIDDNDIYQTPVALMPANRKNKAKELAEDTDVESSEIEVVEREEKKQRAVDKVS
jgi:hypothetical protein